MVRYKCGFVPLGIFPALIASLISTKSFKLVKENVMKNLVRFRCGHLRTLVSLLCYPKFYAIVISMLPVVAHEIHEECAAVKQKVTAGLEKVSSRMNYGHFLEYQFAFECPRHSGEGHLSVVDDILVSPKIMDCLQNPNNPEPVKMESKNTVWFYKVCLRSFLCFIH